MRRQMTVLVTGAASGIGNASARQLLGMGHNTTVLDLNAEALRAAFQGYNSNVAVVVGDVSNPDVCAKAVGTTVARFGQLDAVIHWAARHSSLSWADLTADEFNRTLAINTTGSFLIAQAAARHMVQQKSGAIVLTSSSGVIAGTTGGSAGNGGPAYVSSKAAITGLVRSLARALGPSGIRVNAVTPGVTDTPMIAAYSEDNRAIQQARVALGRIGQPEDIASVAAFLISDESTYISGENIIVNGGASFG